MFNPQRLTQVLQPDKSTVPQAAAGNHSRLQGRAAMRVAASAICVSYILSTLPTPLYVIYRQTFQFSQIMLTVIYAVYVVGTVTTMFFLGRLSDQIGRSRWWGDLYLRAKHLVAFSRADFLRTGHRACVGRRYRLGGGVGAAKR